MAMLKVCSHPECGTLTLGELCIEHESMREPRLDPAARVVPTIATAARVHTSSRAADGRRSGV